jgi:hypothetical protein
MARIHTAGFESGVPATPKAYDGESNNDSNGGINHVMVGTVTYQSTVARNGGLAMQCNPSGANYTQISDFSHAASVPMYVRFYFRTDDVTPSVVNLQIWSWRLNGVVAADIVLKNTGVLALRDANGTQVGSAFTPSANTWYRVESKIVIPAAGNGELEWKVDGITISSSASVDVNNDLTPVTHRIGHQTLAEAQSTIYIDDLAINDGSGSDNTGYPGPGNITLLKPTGDFLKQTGWVAGAGGATLYPAVDNVPPAGVINASATDTSQIKNITSLGAASSYYAACQTGTAAGLPSDAIIKISQALARVSTSDNTGVNTMDIQGIVPSDTAITVDAEVGTVGQTDPLGWKTARTLYTSLPALAVGATPLLRVAKTVTGTTRSHMADQMGMLIEWSVPVAVAVNQVTETDSVQLITPLKTVAVGQNTTTDTAQAITVLKTVVASQTSEADTALAITKIDPILAVINQVSESDSAQVVTTAKAEEIGQNLESDTAQSVSPVRVIAIGQATETDSSQVLTSAKKRTNGTNNESDEAFPLQSLKRVALGQSSESDLSQPLTIIDPILTSITQPSETDSAQAISVKKVRAIGQVTETDTTQTITIIDPILKSITQPSEVDTAQAIIAAKSILLGQISETDSVEAINLHKTKAIAQTTETDSAQPVVRIILVEIDQAVETDNVESILHTKQRTINQVSETDTAGEITDLRNYLTSQASEIDSAQSIDVHKLQSLNQSTENDVAQAVTTSKIVNIGQVSEDNFVQSVEAFKSRLLGAPEESDSVHEVDFLKQGVLIISGEEDTALSIDVIKRRHIVPGQVSTVDTASPITVRKSRTTQTVFEAETAQQIKPARGYLIDYAAEGNGSFGLGHLKRKQIGNGREHDQSIPIGIDSPIFYPSSGTIQMVTQMRDLIQKTPREEFDLGDNRLVINADKQLISVENNEFNAHLLFEFWQLEIIANQQILLIGNDKIMCERVGIGADGVEEFKLVVKQLDTSLKLKTDDRILTVRS